MSRVYGERQGACGIGESDARPRPARLRQTFSLLRDSIRVPLPALMIALLAGLAVAPWTHGPRVWVGDLLSPRARVYTVGEVRSGLSSNARAWIGHPLRIQGRVVLCLAVPSVGTAPCLALAPAWWPRDGVAPSNPAALLPLPLLRAPPPAWLGRLHVLRRLPLLTALLPVPQTVHPDAVAIYRVAVRAVTPSLCGSGPCYEAVLLEAA